MNHTRTGFATVRSTPAVILAEIGWRWAFGAFAWLLVFFTVRTIMAGIDISNAEATLVRTNDVYLIADAITRVIVQVLPRFLAALVLIVPLLAIAWIVAATIGRSITLDALLREQPGKREDVASSEAEASVIDSKPRKIYGFRVFRLNCLRAVFSIATILAFFGTVFLVSAQVGRAATPDVGPAYVLGWLFLAFAVGCFWGLVNWFLALAPIFIVRDGLGAWRSIGASIALYRDNKREYASIGTWFGFLRGAALLVAIVAGMSAVATSFRAGLVVSILVALAYFAVADYLYIARLAAYVSLAAPSTSAVLTMPSVEPPQPESQPAITQPETESETETHSELS